MAGNDWGGPSLRLSVSAGRDACRYGLEQWLLFQPSAGHFIFIPAEIVAEFVQVREPHLVPVDGFVALGQIPEVFEEKQYLWWQRCFIVLELAAVLRTDKQTQKVRFQALGLKGVIGLGFIANRHG